MLSLSEKLELVEETAKKDMKYQVLLQKIRKMEKEIDKLEQTLENAQRDIIWNFWGLSTEMDHRLLEIACSLDFQKPDETE